jgi:hypothetical protein
MIIRFLTVIALIMALTGCSEAKQASAANVGKPGPRPPLALGVDLGGLPWYNNNRVYANLILDENWRYAPKDGNLQDLPPQYIDDDGWLRPMPPGARAFRTMNHPNFTNGSVEIICRYTGKATIEPIWHGLITDTRHGKNSLRFRWQTTPPRDDRPVIANIYLEISDVDPVDPIRNIDCRETTLDPAVRFNPAFVRSLRGFSVIRYLGLMNQSNAPTLTWATRKKVTNGSMQTADGMPVEDLVQLANEAQVSPWFNLPWQADDDYQRRFADYVHANLDPKLVAHVELANEVWNDVFWAAYSRFESEGVARKLASDPYEAVFRRYGQRLTEIMKIWTEVYQDRPKSLVRIAATQFVYTDSSKFVLGFADTAKWVDALAVAPYFAFDKKKYPLDSGLDNIFKGIDESIDGVLDQTERHRAIADQYGVRFITYEAGQHIAGLGEPLMKAINRDPRMETAYRRYIDGWRDRNGDLMTILQDVAGIDGGSAWGLREWLDQPLEQAPKARAVAAYLSPANKDSK